MAIWLIGGIVWVACGVLVYGLVLALFVRDFPSLHCDSIWASDRRCAMLVPVFGVLGLIGFIIFSWFIHGVPCKHGLMFRKPKDYGRAGK